MKYRFALAALVMVLAGCEQYRDWDHEAGGYGASLTMGGGSGVTGVYPDAGYYWSRNAAWQSGSAIGGTGIETNVIWGSAAQSGTNNLVAPAVNTNAVAPAEQALMPANGQEPVPVGAAPVPPPDPNSPAIPAPELGPQPAPAPNPQPAPAPAPQPNGPPSPAPARAPAPQPQPAPAPQPHPAPQPQP